jgi:hypothetical protein
MSSLDTEQTNDPLRGECERKMLFPIVLFLIVLSPLFIPIAVTVVYEFGNWRENLAARPARPVRHFRPAVGMVPAAA